MTTPKDVAVNNIKKDALASMAERLQVDPEILRKTLKATVFKVKGENGTVKEASDEEFISLMVIANTYNLNPITKELYAFPAKGGGIVPIVSTDGWTRIMTTHHDYKSHSFAYAEKMVTMNKAKPCPEWCEVTIEKQDGTSIVIREYLDEVFRDLTYLNPWQTHTKRFLRHKTKIQGAREAFGFAGIYDEDEAERIVEIKEVKQIEMPRKKVEAVQEAPKTTTEQTETAVTEEKPQETAQTVENEVSEAVPTTEDRPLPAGYAQIKAIQDGRCHGCKQIIPKESEFLFSAKKGSFHFDCVPV